MVVVLAVDVSGFVVVVVVNGHQMDRRASCLVVIRQVVRSMCIRPHEPQDTYSNHVHYSCTLQLYVTAVFYSCTLQLRYNCTLQLYVTAVRYSCTLQLEFIDYARSMRKQRKTNAKKMRALEKHK